MVKVKITVITKVQRGNRILTIKRELGKPKMEYPYTIYDSLNHNIKSPFPLDKNEVLKIIEEML